MLTTLVLPYRGQPRRVRVYAPPERQNPAPALVLFDGQNVFHDEGSFAGGWHAHHAVDALPPAQRPIVVAVDHGNRGRFRELWADLDSFVAFLERDVLPEVRGRWQVGSRVAIGGSSLGGLGALLAHYRDPARWDRALVMSPSLWVGRGAPLREVRTIPTPVSSRIYLDVGRKEKGVMPLLAERLAAELGERGYGPRDLLWNPDDEGTHHESHWRKRLPAALRFLFGAGGAA